MDNGKKNMNKKVIISSSFGKDSTAMIHLMLEKGEQIDEILFFETGWDFPQMEDHIKQVQKKTGLKIIRIRHYRYFDEMLSKMGWPRDKKPGLPGWCNGAKRDNCNKYIRYTYGTVECIGYTTNEIKRAKRPSFNKKKWRVRFPLIEYGFSESDALSYCKSLGYNWGGLYDVFNRVSCFCCPNAGKKRIEILKSDFPKLYQRYLEMDEIANSAKPIMEAIKEIDNGKVGLG